MAAKYNSRMITRSGLSTRKKNLALLPKFPKDSKVKWKHSEDVLTVTGHDTSLGRVETHNGGSYNPDELELVESKEG